MNSWVVRGLLLCSVAFASYPLAAEEDVDKAREALAKQEGDEDTTEQLEEVFQAAERQYSLLGQGKQTLTFSSDYSFTGDQRLDLEVVNNSIRNLDITPSATHTFTNAFTYDYGLKNNITLSARAPLVIKFDTQEDLDAVDIGDFSSTVRWQPIAYVPGKVSTTLFGTLRFATGVSPYEIDVNQELSTGSGYHSFGGGISMSKVLDPVVLFGSTSFTYGIPVDDLNQVRGARLLREVEPGTSFSGSMGFSYSLSYDVSLSMSFQGTFTTETTLKFAPSSDSPNGSEAVAEDQMSGFLSISVGTRVSETKIVNTNVGIGLTEDTPDFSIGFSLPINIAGLKDF